MSFMLKKVCKQFNRVIVVCSLTFWWVTKWDSIFDKPKSDLEKSKFEEQVSNLRNKIIDFNKEKKIFSNNLNKKKLNGTNQILNTLNLILTDYATKNSISLILQKKNILLGENSIDITQDILKLLDNKIKKINLK